MNSDNNSRLQVIPWERVRRDLMLGLLYPAVLGSILYSWLGEAATQVAALTNSWWLGSPYHYDNLATIKFLLLLVTLAFYFCDYLYIYFINNYRWWFFFCDLGFLITLYFTVFSIHIGSSASPNHAVIVICFVLFILLYLGWDLYERKHSQGQENKFYGKVVRWEWASLIVLVPLFIWAYNTPHLYLSWIILVILITITAFFAKYAFEKRGFYRQ